VPPLEASVARSDSDAGGATGFVVAGGQSRRMGRDKALLPWQGATLLDHALARLRAACPAVRILSGRERRYEDRGVAVDVDAVPEAGPLGAIYTGLLQVGPGVGVFLAVDLPFVPVALLRRLLELAEGNDAVVPLSARGPEPLCAVYRATCLDPVRRRLHAGDRKATSFWKEVRVLQAGVTLLSGLGPVDGLFRNVNTPGDYESARDGTGD
jgi:molybdopterin-guanine dinucleotide biosynthesis protein A